MTLPLRFQVLSLPKMPWAELADRVRRLEALGVEVAALADHFVDWTNPPSPWFESMTALTGLAASTSTIRLTSCVAQIPLRNPAMLARQVMTLDHISNGRIELGLGTGLTIDPSYEMIGIPNWTTGERVVRFAEYVHVVAGLLANESFTFAGKHYAVTGAMMNPGPVQLPRPPIMIGVLGPQMISIAAQHADIWNSLSFHESFDDQLAETRDRIDLMRRCCDAKGRAFDSLRVSYTMFDATARPKGGTIDYYESVDRFEDMVGRVLALGVTEVSLYYPLDAAQVPVFERVCTDVMPKLRAG